MASAEIGLSAFKPSTDEKATRLIGLCFLLLAEIVWVTLRFDTALLASRDDLGSLAFQHAPQLLRIGLAILGGFLIVSVGSTFAPLLAFKFARHRSAPFWLTAHLIAYAIFITVIQVVFQPESASPIFSLVAWGSAAVTLATWLLALLPVYQWLRLASSFRVGILVGIACGLAAWGLGHVFYELWRPFATGTLWLVHVQLSLMYSDVQFVPEQAVIGTPSFLVQVSSECSGYEGIGLMLAFMVTHLTVFREQLRFPAALSLVLIGTALVWLLNTTRIALLIAVGTSWSRGLALGGFHSQAGWIFFISVALGLAYASLKLPLFSQTARAAQDGTCPTGTYTFVLLSPLLAVLCARMFTTALSESATVQSLIIFLAGTLLLIINWPMLRRLDWSFSPWSVVIGGVIGTGWLIWVSLASEPLTGERIGVIQLCCQLACFILVTPIVEELAFRGFLPRRLTSPTFSLENASAATWAGILVSATVFGALHGANWLPGVCAGLALSALFRWQKRIGDPCMAHLTANGFLAVAAVWIGDPRLLS